MRLLMWMALCPLALAAPARVVLLEELVRLESMQQKAVLSFPLEQQNAQLEVDFEAKRPGEGIKVLVRDLTANRVVQETGYEGHGVMKMPLQRNSTYRVEVENMRQRLGFALVDMQVALVFGAQAAEARTLDPKRRYFTVAASLTLFAMIVAYASVRLGPVIVERCRR